MSKSMQVFVKTIQGNTICIDISMSNTVLDLKYKIQDTQGIPPEMQILSFQGKLMSNYMRLKHYNIKLYSVINLSASLRSNNIILPKDKIVSLNFTIKNTFWDIINIYYDNINKIKYMDSFENASISNESIKFKLLYSKLLKFKTFKCLFKNYFDNIFDCNVLECLYFKTFNHSNEFRFSLNINNQFVDQKLKFIKNDDGIYNIDLIILISYPIYAIRKVAELNQYVSILDNSISNLEDKATLLEVKINKYKDDISLCKHFGELYQYKSSLNNDDRKDWETELMDFTLDLERTRHEYAYQYSEYITPILKEALEILKTAKPGDITKIKDIEKDLGNLDLTLHELNDLYDNKLVRMELILKDELIKQQKSLERNYLEWNINDLVNYFEYLDSNFKIPNKVLNIFKELKLFENKKMNEINESLLILCQWNDIKSRNFFLKHINKILKDNNGFMGSNDNEKNNKCCICATLTPNTVNVPCGHICYCFGCSQESLLYTNQCPMCRCELDNIIKIYQ